MYARVFIAADGEAQEERKKQKSNNNKNNNNRKKSVGKAERISRFGFPDGPVTFLLS